LKVLHKQAGQTTVLTKRCEIAEKRLQCRSHPQIPFASPSGTAAQLRYCCRWRVVQHSVAMSIDQRTNGSLAALDATFVICSPAIYALMSGFLSI